MHTRPTRNPRTSQAVIAMPDRALPILGIAAASLVAVYLVLMVTTIFFAAWETQLARSMDDTRERIHKLETEYYNTIAKIDSTDPSAVGLVAPAKVEYVVAARMQGLTYVSR